MAKKQSQVKEEAKTVVTPEAQEPLSVVQTDKKAEDAVASISLDPQEMVRAGVQFGHRKSRQHPTMSRYVFSVRNNVSLIELDETVVHLKKALLFIFQLAREGKIILFVASEPPANKILQEVAPSLGMPCLTDRWLGGIITNFNVIRSRIDHYKDLKTKKDSGELEKYTKKEQHDFDLEIAKLEKKFGGLVLLERLPDAVFISSIARNALPAREAKRKGIPVIAICDTNADTTLVDYVIPANDDAFSSVQYVLEKIAAVVQKAKS